MANIQNELNNIKTALYGKDVRNSIHDAIKTCYDDASVNNDNANMEVKLARGTHNTLNDRLCEVDEKQNFLSSQLEQKANEADLQTQKSRIDNIVKLEEGSTTGDAELIDGRVGIDSTVYANIGDAVRTQINDTGENIKQIRELIGNGLNISITKKDGAYLKNNGTYEEDSLYHCKTTNKIYCNEGWVFSYNGTGASLAVSWIMYNENKIITTGKATSTTQVVIPPGVNNIVFSSFNEINKSVVLEVELLKPCVLNKNNIVNNLNSSIGFEQLNAELGEFITSENINNLIENHNYNFFENYINVNDNYTFIKGSYVLGGTGELSSDTNSLYTDYIQISDFVDLYRSSHSQYYTCTLAIYDETKTFLGSQGYAKRDGETMWELHRINADKLKREYKGAYYIRVCSYLYTKYPLNLYIKKATLEDIVNEIKNRNSRTENSNILYGKKWVACGDSFTEGDFTGYVDENGLSGKNSSVIYDSFRGMYKTYPWWIAERNTMELINEAKCGSDFTNIEGASNPFSVSRYLAVPTDADYITLMFGLNETSLTSEQIGTKTDTTNSTLWGAYNIVFEHFLTNMPYAKIGVIIADAWMNETYANAVKSICAYWGIPVLDLKFDTNIPMGLNGRPNESNIARRLRDNAFKVTSTNNHPNLEAHKYRSTFIEHWLRSL